MDWRKMIKLNQLFLSAVVFAAISQVVHTIGAAAMMDYYTNPDYFPLWSTLMMPAEGPPGSEFFMASIVISFVIGLVFAAVYQMIKGSIPGTGVKKGLNYGLLLFLLVGVPYTLTSYLILAIPTTLLMAWAVESFVIYLLSGLAFSNVFGN